MPKLTVGSLFAGVGGIELGLEMTGGFETVWQVENDEYATRVLEKHWPGVRRWGDIKDFNSWIKSLAISSPAAFPVKTSATLENVPALPEPVRGSGGKWCEPFAWYDQSTCLWRTWQRCLIEGWERFSGTWPRSGMTRNGIAYRRPPLVPLTAVIGRSLLPTCRAADARGSTYQYDRGDHSKSRLTLLGWVRLHPTLTARDARTIKGNVPPPKHIGGPSLAQLLGDPEAGGRLNPVWCEWYMGFPMHWTASDASGTP